MPERGHPDYGVVRAIVRDAADAASRSPAPFFLDSDGCVADPSCPSAPPNTNASSPSFVSVRCCSCWRAAAAAAECVPAAPTLPRPPTPPLPAQTPDDGRWHLLGVTTHPDGGKGCARMSRALPAAPSTPTSLDYPPACTLARSPNLAFFPHPPPGLRCTWTG